MNDAHDEASQDALPGAHDSAATGVAAPANTVYLDTRPGETRVVLVGELDISNHAQLEQVAAQVAERTAGPITVDLSAATFVDSGTLGFFAKLHNQAEVNGQEFTLYAPQRVVERALEVVGFDRVMRVVRAGAEPA
jgi:anti-anti-sigma factor